LVQISKEDKKKGKKFPTMSSTSCISTIYTFTVAATTAFSWFHTVARFLWGSPTSTIYHV